MFKHILSNLTSERIIDIKIIVHENDQTVIVNIDNDSCPAILLTNKTNIDEQILSCFTVEPEDQPLIDKSDPNYDLLKEEKITEPSVEKIKLDDVIPEKDKKEFVEISKQEEIVEKQNEVNKKDLEHPKLKVTKIDTGIPSIKEALDGIGDLNKVIDKVETKYGRDVTIPYKDENGHFMGGPPTIEDLPKQATASIPSQTKEDVEQNNKLLDATKETKPKSLFDEW